MKKLFTFLTLLVAVASAAWGDNTLFDVDFSAQTNEEITTSSSTAVFVAKTYNGYNMSMGIKTSKPIKIIDSGLEFTSNNYNDYTCLAIPLTLTANNKVTATITLASAGRVKFSWVSGALPSTPNAGSGTSYGTSSTTNTLEYTPTEAGSYVLYLGRNGSSDGKVIKSIVITQVSAASTTPATVSFDAGDHGTYTGSSLEESSAGAGITLPYLTTSATGYTFNGWYTAATGGTKAGDAGATYNPSANITLYAQYSAKTYSITLDNNGGTADGSATATYDSNTLTSITAPTNAGQSVAGYYKEVACTNLIADASGNLQANTDYTDASGNWTNDGNVTLYAKWEAFNPIIFSMTNVTGPTETLNSKTKSAVTATFNPGSEAEVYNGKSSAAALVTNSNTINLGGSSSSYFHAKFLNPLAEGDVITSSTINTFYLSKNSTKGSSVTFPYTIPAESPLIGATDVYVWKNGGSTFTSFTIRRPAEDEVNDPVITFTNNTLTLACSTTGSTIYYTTDGTEPTTSSTAYSTPVVLTNSCTVRAKAFKGASNEYSSDIAKSDCYVDHSSATGFLAKLGSNGGSLNDSRNVWTSANGKYTLTNNNAGRTIDAVNLAEANDGFKINHVDPYTLQVGKAIKVTKIVVVGKTWLQGGEGVEHPANASTMTITGFTKTAGTFYEYPKGGSTDVGYLEFTPDTELDYGATININPATNQLGAWIEVYGEEADQVEAPVISPATFTSGPQEVTITCATDGATIYYTTDGTIPTTNSNVYNSESKPTISNTTTIKAIGVKDTYLDSEVATATIVKGSFTTIFDYSDAKSISQLESAGWAFNAATANPTSTGEYVNLVSAFNSSTAETITALKKSANNVMDFDDNALAFAKNTSATATFDLGEAKTVNGLAATLYGGSTNSFNQTIEYLAADGSTILKSYTAALSAGNWQVNNITKSDIVENVRYIRLKGASKWVVMYDLKVSFPDEYVSGTITASGWSTFSSNAALDLSTITGGTAYVASTTAGNAVTLTPCTDKVAAGTGLMIKGTAGATFIISTTTDAATFSGSNKLVGLPNGGTVTANANNYVFGWTNPTDPGFYFVNSTEPVLGVGKAYLHTDAALSLARLAIVFDEGEATGIHANEELRMKNAEVVFDLQGRRVAQPTKGLYIINGKKIFK